MLDLNTNRLREISANLLADYDQHQSTSLFAGLYEEVDASVGFFKAAAAALIGEPEEWTGAPVIRSVATASVVYEPKAYQYTFGINVNELGRLNTLASNAFNAKITRLARKWIGFIDRRLTALLVTGESTGSFAGTAIFSSTAPLLNGQQINNVYGPNVSGSASEVLAAIHEGRVLMNAMRNMANDLVRSSTPTVALMYSPNGQTGEEQSVMDALKAQLVNDRYKFGNDEIVLRPNYYLGANPDMWLFDVSSSDKMFVLGVEQQPDFWFAGNDAATRINTRKVLAATSMVFEVAFSGNPMQGVLLNDA